MNKYTQDIIEENIKREKKNR